jgi:hypothetical protein
VCYERRQAATAANMEAAQARGSTGLSSPPERRHARMKHIQQRSPPRLRCAKRRAMGASCSPTGNRRISVRSPAAGALSASCTGEAPPLWSAVCSQTRMGGHHRGAKMTRGGGRLTSRAPTRARSASAPQGRQEPGRRPACDAMDIDGDSDEQPTGLPRDGRAGHRHEGDHIRAGQRAVSRALRVALLCTRPVTCMTPSPQGVSR